MISDINIQYREEWISFLSAVDNLRPELHRYCARLTGSVIDGEDIVQDALLKAFIALRGLKEPPPLRPWLFRIAHNRALDLMRSSHVRLAEPIEAAADIVDADNPNPLEQLMHQESIKKAITYFVDLPIAQRSVVILKDVLGESLAEIAALLDLSIDAVKGHLARGRSRLSELNREINSPVDSPPTLSTSTAVAQYVHLFNQRDWDGLRALLSHDVKLKQSSHPLRTGVEDVGTFFTIYAQYNDVRLAPAWLDGRQVIAVFEHSADLQPHHIMWIEWSGAHISFIHDYRYTQYMLADAQLKIQQFDDADD